MISPTQLGVNRIIATFNTVLMLSTPLLQDWQRWLFPVIGTLLLAYFPALWLRQNMRFYNWCWYGTAVIGLAGIGLPNSFGNAYAIGMGGLWFALYLAALPPRSGKTRRRLGNHLKKWVRSWSRGIPIPTLP